MLVILKDVSASHINDFHRSKVKSNRVLMRIVVVVFDGGGHGTEGSSYHQCEKKNIHRNTQKSYESLGAEIFKKLNMWISTCASLSCVLKGRKRLVLASTTVQRPPLFTDGSCDISITYPARTF